MSKLPSVLFTFAIAACGVDAPDASDPTTTVESDVTTILDNCAVSHAANAFEDINGPTETYTRHGDPMINTTCDCDNWQEDANANGEAQADLDHPNCRPDTFVNFKWEVWYPILAWNVEVPSWSLTNGDTECNNSTLVVSYWKETSPNTWTKQGATQTVQPHPLANGTCSSVSIGGGGTADGVRYRIHALATRGLDSGNHGFETLKVTAYGFNE